MQNKFKIIDESGDRKYFTIIPNYIINHSTVYEQSIYLYMKRIAGETGTCWSSAKTIGKDLGIARNTVKKYRQELEKRGWIKVIGKKGKTRPTDEYEIVDLWDLNIKHYSPKDSSPHEQSFTNNKKIVHHVNKDSSPRGHKEEHIKKNHILTTNVVNSKTSVNSLINKFQSINPSYQKLFSNKTQRAALERLLDTLGENKVIRAIDAACKVYGVKYAPRITTPLQLENKLGDLIAFYKSEQDKGERVHYAR